MKYQAKPITVDAYKISRIGESWPNGNLQLFLERRNGPEIIKEALPDMMSRMRPIEGDYWVIAPDGYEYLNPKAVFESKYEAAPNLSFGEVLGQAAAAAVKPVSHVYDQQKPELGLQPIDDTTKEIEHNNRQAANSPPTVDNNHVAPGATKFSAPELKY